MSSCHAPLNRSGLYSRATTLMVLQQFFEEAVFHETSPVTQSNQEFQAVYGKKAADAVIKGSLIFMAQLVSLLEALEQICYQLKVVL